jgi:adenine-specific DNA-methyltransferase
MDKLKMRSINKVDENVKRIGDLFPNTLTEVIKGYKEDGTPIIETAIDFDMLKQELSNVVVEGNEERFQFMWPDKKKSVLLANAPIAKTLRPCKEESVDFDKTENLYIEGDNLDVLKLLQETYLNKVKMIYIDPPYNTGNDFVYEDDYAQNTEEYLANSGQYDEEGNRLMQNTERNGRFHTDWLNMMYPRLKLAKDLLVDDGVIFISIDDGEVANLRKLCDEVFGQENFVDTVVWEKRYSPQNAVQWFSESHDFILVYAKRKDLWFPNLLERTEEMNARYKNMDDDPRGDWKATDATAQGGHGTTSQFYVLRAPNGKEHHLTAGRCWVYTEKVMNEMIADNRVWFGSDGNNVPALKRFLTEVKQGTACQTIWGYREVGHNQEGKKEIKDLFKSVPFDTPKPTRLLKRIVKLATNQDDIILDFFSGSATTAHAVMQLNAEDGGNRRFICVQLPEVCDEKSDAFKAGYQNICEIGKERIRRAGQKIKEGHKEKESIDNLDIGFRVLKVDSTNMKDVYYSPQDYQPELFDNVIDNIKEDRTAQDLLFQVMLDLGVLISSKIMESMINGKKVFDVADGYLMACYDHNVTDDTIKEIAMKKPYYFVMRDSSMASDSVATNFDQIFETYSPDTIRKVL